MARMPGSLLIGISSRTGGLACCGGSSASTGASPGNVLVVKAPTEVLNPRIDRATIAEAYEDDPEAARAEWGAEFRTDLADFVSRRWSRRWSARAYTSGRRSRGAVSSRSRIRAAAARTAFTLAIAHREREVAVVDCVRERRPPFSPEAVVEEFSGLLQSYGLHEVVGRSLWRGVAAGAVRQARHHLSAERVGEVGDLLGELAVVEWWPG